MKKTLLKEGDVFNLKEGWSIETLIPKKFVYSNNYSSELTNALIKVGHNYLFYKDKDLIIDITREVIDLFDYKGIDINYKIVSDFVKFNVDQNIKNENDTFVFKPGEFLVIDVKLTGGGYGHGHHDVYPNGWEIKAIRLKDGNYDEKGDKIYFYQTGSFINLIEDEIPVIKTMKVKFV